MTTYVIREKYFGYNDEVFYASGNRIASILSKKSKLKQPINNLKSMEHVIFHSMKLNHYLMQMKHY